MTAFGKVVLLLACFGVALMVNGCRQVVVPTRNRIAASLSNTKQLCMAMHMYMQDGDTSLPPADKWSDALMPYIDNNEELLRCPLAPDLDCGYAFNEALDSRKLNDVADPAGTVVLFTSNLGTHNGAGGVDAVADPPRTPTGNIYGYMDGHVKIDDEIPNFDPSKGRR